MCCFQLTLASFVDICQRSCAHPGLIIYHLRYLFALFGNTDVGNNTAQSSDIAGVVIGSLVGAAKGSVAADNESFLDVARELSRRAS